MFSVVEMLHKCVKFVSAVDTRWRVRSVRECWFPHSPSATAACWPTTRSVQNWFTIINC